MSRNFPDKTNSNFVANKLREIVEKTNVEEEPFRYGVVAGKIQTSICYATRSIYNRRGDFMALYALGDLHLSFQSDKSMDIFGSVWKHHERKIEKYVNRIVKPDDTLVLTGDHSWGRKLPECREDLAFIERLPGRKILLRGNHDMFWDAKKT